MSSESGTREKLTGEGGVEQVARLRATCVPEAGEVWLLKALPRKSLRLSDGLSDSSALL